ncbi:UNVERIFIED_CONTAM: 1-aminocyclopropane-1-carboxylate oxidase 5 [Sesamum latifolium]|uniref:1-aminocyclopropane-1-carboxylate oxidase 5 n=1 Tax=Sesamum latifolium TaxID=2727402 RepID=A0AAW2S2R2_9LAMI
MDWEDVFLLSDENHEEWPSKTIGFKETMKEYRAELKRLGHKVMEIMDENLGLPKGYIKNAFDGGIDNTAFFGTKMLKDGVWTDVQPLKNAIVINTGDQIEVLSNGRYKSILHRIVPQTDGQRRSIASFYNPSLKATIQPAPQLLDAMVEKQVKNVAKYPKFVFGDYMSVYLEQKFQSKEPSFQAVAAI